MLRTAGISKALSNISDILHFFQFWILILFFGNVLGLRPVEDLCLLKYEIWNEYKTGLQRQEKGCKLFRFYQFSLFRNEREELSEFCCNSKLWYLHFTPKFWTDMQIYDLWSFHLNSPSSLHLRSLLCFNSEYLIS